MKKIILGIETSCDETAIALIEAEGGLSSKTLPKFKILKETVASQVEIHRPFGGVVPNLAKREHARNLPLLLKKLLPTTHHLPNIDLIAVTVGPGLEPALWQGIEFAKQLQKDFRFRTSNPPQLIGVNHLEAHLYSFLLKKKPTNYELRTTNLFPAIALIVSGGHSILLKMDSLTKWKKLGETRDDAVGEAFDKVARLLKLPYPGGPEIQKLVLNLPRNWKDPINFPRPMLYDKNYDFSFSGLKTAVLYYLRDHPRTKIQTVAAAFSAAALEVLVKKTSRAVQEFKGKSILLSGGVAANRILRNELATEAKRLEAAFFVPDFKYNTDNASMIGVAGYLTWLRKEKGARRNSLTGGYPLRANGLLSI